MATPAKCACCGAKVYRDRHGRIVMHTKNVIGEKYGDPLRAVICEGSDRGSRP